MSTSDNPSNSIWPNGLTVDSEGYATFYSLGSNKVTIPATTEEWPTGNKLISPFVYEDDKLVGFCDTKSFILNDSGTTEIPYEHIEADFSTIENGTLTINSPNCENPEIKYQELKSLPIGYKRVEYLESPSTSNGFINAYFYLPLDIYNKNGVKTGVTSPEYKFTYETEHMPYAADSTVQSEGCRYNRGAFGWSTSIARNGVSIFWDGNNSPDDTTGSKYDNDYILHGNSAVEDTYRDFYYDVNWPITGVYNKIKISIDENSIKYYLNDNLEINKEIIAFAPNVKRPHFTLFGGPPANGWASSDGTSGYIYAPAGLKGKKKSAKIWVNDSLIYDLAPVLDETGCPCMYNQIDGKTFYPEVGEFIVPADEYSIQTLQLDTISYAKKTEYGVRRLYKVPAGESVSLEEYAKANNFKELIETECPAEGYWQHEWVETDTQLILQWTEIEVSEDIIME